MLSCEVRQRQAAAAGAQPGCSAARGHSRAMLLAF